MILFKVKETAHFNSDHVLFQGLRSHVVALTQENVHDTFSVLFVGHVNSGPDQNSAAYEQCRHCLYARIQKVLSEGVRFDNVFLS